jgi:hypothetical protein
VVLGSLNMDLKVRANTLICTPSIRGGVLTDLLKSCSL